MFKKNKNDIEIICSSVLLSKQDWTCLSTDEEEVVETTWQERLVEEQKELKEKYDALVVFLKTAAFKELDNKAKGLLEKQSIAMKVYLETLDQRIALIK